jgi:aryl-alcohol dehydrogenase-like predicted oxidoreductase
MPVIGIGTARNRFTLDQPPEEIAMRRQVFQEFTATGGRMLDIFRGEGAEILCGNLIQELGNRDQFFIATKMNVNREVQDGADPREAGVAQMNESFRRFNTDIIDLMQIHNLADWENQLPILREWKQEGRFRYIGMTVWTSDQHEDLEAVMRQEDLDFIQLDYSLEGRMAEERLLPLAADRGMAVIINVPFRRAGVPDDGTGHPEVHRLAPVGDVCHTRRVQDGIPAGQHGRRGGPHAGRHRAGDDRRMV